MSEIAVRQQAGALAFPDESEMGHVMKVVRSISRTEFVPRSLRGNDAAILACVLTGRALGLDPMHALRAIHIVDGKPTLSAELMVTLARRAGHSIEGNFSPDSVTCTGKRGDNGNTMVVTWTTEMAARAGLSDKQNWKKYPEAMLWARAVSQLCRMLFADVLFGVSYTTEELDGDEVALPDADFDVDGDGPADEGLPVALQPNPDDHDLLAERETLVTEVLDFAAKLGRRDAKEEAISKSRATRTLAADVEWLRGEKAKGQRAVDALNKDAA